MSTVPRVRAPELVGRGWLNTEGPLRLADLRGRFVLLDFWTFCCINCLHVIEELRPVEEAHRDHLVVVGVHSPKFEHEADPHALVQAVERYRVDHPVLDDPELRTWQAYAARAWPTLVLVDPDGYAVAQYAGEGHAHAIDALVTELAPRYELAGGVVGAGSRPREESTLRFPAQAIRLDDGSVLVADTGHDRIAHLEPDAATVRGTFEGLHAPNGLSRLPADVASEVGYDVVVADTGSGRVLGLATNATTSALDPVELATGLNSPWDMAWWRGRVWIAMAGDHTLATYDPVTGVVEHVAGTTNEGLLDGPLLDAWFAQPSALAPDGDRLWLVDAETSSLRYVADGPDGPDDLRVTTVVGEGLFDFGFRDGPRADARMQHPLGVAVLDGSVLVADTYNGAVRRYHPATGELTTVARGLAEPSGLLVGDAAGVLVLESAAHRLTPIELVEERVEGAVSRTHRPVTDVASEVALRVSFTPPPGQKVDERFGPATQLHVSATPSALLLEGDGVSPGLERMLRLDRSVGDGVLHLAARAASCDDDGGDGAACHLHQQDWGIPVRVTPDGAPDLVLALAGPPG